MSKIEHIRPSRLSKNPAYTQVVAARGARTVFVSGQAPTDADGNVVGAGDLAAQTEHVMENLKTALAAAGATFDDVVKSTTFVVDYQPEHRNVIGAVRGRYISTENPPASTFVGVSALVGPEWLIEIEAIAVTD
jgi:enamine deaminase RidA (YjgF/YER057c/UK114 family)